MHGMLSYVYTLDYWVQSQRSSIFYSIRNYLEYLLFNFDCEEHFKIDIHFIVIIIVIETFLHKASLWLCTSLKLIVKTSSVIYLCPWYISKKVKLCNLFMFDKMISTLFLCFHLDQYGFLRRYRRLINRERLSFVIKHELLAEISFWFKYKRLNKNYIIKLFY